MRDHRIISVLGSDDYPLACRYWQAEAPEALLVFMHGVVSHSLWLEHIAVGLVEHRISCLIVDRRGAGLNQSNRGDAPNVASLMLDLDHVLEWATATSLPVHLCGFCWGANYVVNYLTKMKSEIQSVSLLAPSLFPSARITDQTFLTGDSGEPTEEPVMPLECFTDGPAFESFILPDPLRLKKVSQRMNSVMAELSGGMWLKFLRLQLPTLVVLGEQDEVVDNQATERVYNRLNCDRKQLQILPGKHGIQFDAKEQVVSTLMHWIHDTTTTNKSHSLEI